MIPIEYKRDEFKNVKDYYITKGVAELLQPELIVLMLILIDSMYVSERDYRICEQIKAEELYW